MSLELARHGASVVLAGRDDERLLASATSIREEVPDADLRTLRLDLADLSQVHQAAEEVLESYEQLDLLFANVG